jgi:carboxymethylenebutenolidase
MDRVYVMQLVRSFRAGTIDRRTFLQRATLAVGSAAAAQLLAACGATPADAPPPTPIDESTTGDIPTEEDSFEGLETGMVDYPDREGGELMGYLAHPTDASGNLPGVVVIQEWWGLNEHIKDVTRRFAEQGFVALAPDLYKGVVVTEPDEAQKLVMELDMQEAVREIGQAISYLLDREDVAGDEAGIVGFCMGGGLVLQTVAANDNVGAAVAFYGRTLEAAQATQVNAPVLGLYGSEDSGIPVENVRAMEDAFQEAGVEHEIHIYDGAGHAFFNDTRQSYDTDAAEDAWTRTLDWFRSHLT